MAEVRRSPARADGPLRVLMISTVSISLEGITTVILNYIEGMDRTGMRIDLAAVNHVAPDLRRRIEATGARLFELPSRRRHPLRYFTALRALVRREGYQVVHAHGSSCTLAVELLAAKLGGAPVRCAHSHNSSSRVPWAHRLMKPLFNAVYTHGFACSPPAARWMFGARPCVLLNNGTDTARYSFNPAWREEFRNRLGLEGRLAIGHVANFIIQKNHRFLVRAFAEAARRSPELMLVLIGGGTCFEEIQALVRELGLTDRVIFTGRSTEVPQLLSAMDVMVLPSLYEGLPNVLVEWQAAGLPCLVSEAVSETAKLTPLMEFLPLDEGVWRDAMLTAQPLPNRAAASQDAARDIAAAGYDIKQNAERLRGLYFAYSAPFRAKETT